MAWDCRRKRPSNRTKSRWGRGASRRIVACTRRPRIAPYRGIAWRRCIGLWAPRRSRSGTWRRCPTCSSRSNRPSTRERGRRRRPHRSRHSERTRRCHRSACRRSRSGSRTSGTCRGDTADRFRRRSPTRIATGWCSSGSSRRSFPLGNCSRWGNRARMHRRSHCRCTSRAKLASSSKGRCRRRSGSRRARSRPPRRKRPRARVAGGASSYGSYGGRWRSSAWVGWLPGAKSEVARAALVCRTIVQHACPGRKRHRSRRSG